MFNVGGGGFKPPTMGEVWKKPVNAAVNSTKSGFEKARKNPLRAADMIFTEQSKGTAEAIEGTGIVEEGSLTNPLNGATGAGAGGIGNPADLLAGPMPKAPEIDQSRFDPNQFDGRQRDMGKWIEHYTRQAAPQLNQSQSNAARAQTQSLADALAAQARGEGPSIAQNQLRQATDRSLAQTLAAAQAAPGNPVLAARNAMNQQAQINRGAAMDSAMLRNQEQLNAQGQLGSVLNSMRGQDLQAAGQNLASALQSRGQNMDYSQGMFGQMNDLETFGAGLGAKGEQLNQDRYGDLLDAWSKRYAANAGIVGGAGKGLAAILPFLA